MDKEKHDEGLLRLWLTALSGVLLGMGCSAS